MLLFQIIRNFGNELWRFNLFLTYYPNSIINEWKTNNNWYAPIVHSNRVCTNINIFISFALAFNNSKCNIFSFYSYTYISTSNVFRYCSCQVICPSVTNTYTITFFPRAFMRLEKIIMGLNTVIATEYNPCPNKVIFSEKSLLQ